MFAVARRAPVMNGITIMMMVCNTFCNATLLLIMVQDVSIIARSDPELRLRQQVSQWYHMHTADNL